ncbi:MAG: CCA tRNA nucleotidyltransferase [Candidatus Aenigmatarchaeota archaeon]
MNRTELLLKKVLKRVIPTEKDREKTEEALKRIRAETQNVVKPLGIGYTLAGSYLRDTWLPDKKEFDIFIMFPEKVPRERLEKDGLSAGKAIAKALGAKVTIAYAEHPYVKATVGGYMVDFVPCYDIKEPGRIKSAVDRTPHHNTYILKRLTGELSSEVRLLKQFCKGTGVYGSDLKVEGFSGYLTELLIIKYRTFRNVLSEARHWEAGKIFIDLEGHHGQHPGPKDMFPGQPLAVIDPVDRNRNVAAAVSCASFEKFRARCASFLESPDESYFFPRKETLSAGALSSAFRKRKTFPLAVVFSRPAGIVDDIVFPQMRRSARRMEGMLSGADFRVMGSGVFCGEKECAVFLELEVWTLPSVRRVVGPTVFSCAHSGEFRKKYEGEGRLFVDGQDWVAEVGREVTEAQKALSVALKKSDAALMGAGIASHVARGIGKGFSILSGAGLFSKARSSKGFAAFLTEYLKSQTL